MTKFFAKSVSYLLHPLLLPTYAIILLFCIPGYLQVFPFVFKRAMVTIFFIMTFFAPVIALFLMYNLRFIKSFHLETKKERQVPLALTAAFYLATYILLSIFPQKLPSPIIDLIFVSTLSVCIAFIINLFYKISAHTIAIGSVLGFLIVFFINFNTGNSLYLTVMFLLSGIIAFARLKENAHTPFQIYTGFVVGILAGISSAFL